MFAGFFLARSPGNRLPGPEPSAGPLVQNSRELCPGLLAGLIGLRILLADRELEIADQHPAE